MPKYYVSFGRAFDIVLTAKTPKDASVKCLRRYLSKESLITTNSIDTLNTPEKFKVSERGFAMWNDEDAYEFSHSEISKLLEKDNDKGHGGELCLA